MEGCKTEAERRKKQRVATQLKSVGRIELRFN